MLGHLSFLVSATGPSPTTVLDTDGRKILQDLQSPCHLSGEFEGQPDYQRSRRLGGAGAQNDRVEKQSVGTPPIGPKIGILCKEDYPALANSFLIGKQGSR